MIHLTKVERAQIKAMREEISPWGLATAVIMGGKHVILQVWSRDGHAYRLVVACTPRSAGWSVMMARAKAKRLVRLINTRAGY